MAKELDEAWVEDAITRQRMAEQLRAEVDARIGATEVAVRSPDELVEVRVRADGSIRNVQVVGSLEGRTSREVARSIETAVSAAADAAAWARRTLYSQAALGDLYGWLDQPGTR